jgi:pyruvate dehydrogenase E2 component (dihydrolipoamide acetyltransferase)
MAELLPVPEVAAGATDVVLAEWLVKVGDTFSAGDLIAVIETEKAVVELPAEQDGTLLKTLVENGSQAEVGSPMALIGSPEDLTKDADALLAELGVTANRTTPAPERRDVPSDTAQPEGDEPAFESEDSVAITTAPAPSKGRIFVSPIARKLLREAGLPADEITGSGPNGRIRRRDVEAAIAAGSKREVDAAPSATPTPRRAAGAGASVDRSWTEVPHTRIRRAVAARLTQSKQETPHFYLRRSVQLDALLALRATVNEDSPVRVSVNDFLIRAIAVAHTAVPDANVIWTDDAMHQFSTVDIAVAIASDKGLVTPVLRGVEKTSISRIASQVRDFVEKANAGRLQQQDLEGGSITISNLGMFGVDEFSAIINPPHSAILAVGAAQPTVVVQDGQPTVANAANLVLSVDHRAIDGALAAQWMAALVEAIERPMRLVV